MSETSIDRNKIEISTNLWTFVFLLSLFLGFLFTHVGVGTWDSTDQLDRCNYILHRFGLPMDGRSVFVTPLLEWYGPLWQLILGIFAYSIFPYLQDPTWVRHAVTFSLFPITLFFVWVELQKAGYAKSTALLAVGMLLSFIRLGGQAVLNVGDAPLALTFLITALVSWKGVLRLRQLQEEKKLLEVIVLTVIVTIVTSVPYLIRSPVLLPLGFFSLGVGLICIEQLWKRKFNFYHFIPLVIIPITFIVFTFASWPALWANGLKGHLTGFTIFKDFHAAIPVRALGFSWNDSNLPTWYQLLWLPIGITPLGFLHGSYSQHYLS